MIETGLKPNDIRTVSCFAPPEGMMFDVWDGDIQYLSDHTLAETIVTMGDTNVAIRALFKVYGGYGLLYNWFTTQEQLTINYGYLYNWYAATDSRNIAPVGYHIPTRSEIKTLYPTLNIDGSNSIPNSIPYFTYYKSGYRMWGNFYDINTKTYIWVSEELNESNAWSVQFTNSVQCIYHLKSNGNSLRFIKDDSIDTGYVVGNDGKQYETVKIGNLVITKNNSMETRYRDGTLIPIVTDNTVWAALTTGGRCVYNNLESNAESVKKLAPAGFHIPTNSEIVALRNYLDPINNDANVNTAGGAMKEIGINYWDSPNIGATNSSGFTARGAGVRSDTGIFNGIKISASFWNSYTENIYWGGVASLGYNFNNFLCELWSIVYKTQGVSIRLIKDDPSSWIIGDTVTDQDGNVYQTVKIGSQVWITGNWKSTKWNDGSLINYVEGNIEWASLTTPAFCYPNGNINNK